MFGAPFPAEMLGRGEGGVEVLRKIYENATQLIGRSPLIRLSRLSREYGCRTPVLAKLEGLTPGGSVKDRTALSMIESAMAKGQVDKETAIVEATSGNMGVALSMVCAALGLKAVIVAPEDPGPERRKMMEAFGARLALTPPEDGMKGAVTYARRLCRELKNAFMPCQFENEDNCNAHRENTAAELLECLPQVDYFIAGVGTGGTLTGCGEVLKRHFPECKAVAVEPVDCSVLSGGFPGAHGLQGIGAGFIPKILNEYIIDEIIRVRTPDSFALSRQLARLEGLLCGMSSGAALAGAVEVARRPEAKDKTVVTLLPDTGLLYLSAGLFD